MMMMVMRLDAWLAGWLAAKVRGEDKAAVGGSIHMKHPYLSNILTTKPARQHPQCLESTAKAHLCPSLTFHGLAVFQKTTGWGRKKKRDECHQR